MLCNSLLRLLHSSSRRGKRLEGADEAEPPRVRAWERGWWEVGWVVRGGATTRARPVVVCPVASERC